VSRGLDAYEETHLNTTPPRLSARAQPSCSTERTRVARCECPRTFEVGKAKSHRRKDKHAAAEPRSFLVVVVDHSHLHVFAFRMICQAWVLGFGLLARAAPRNRNFVSVGFSHGFSCAGLEKSHQRRRRDRAHLASYEPSTARRTSTWSREKKPNHSPRPLAPKSIGACDGLTVSR